MSMSRKPATSNSEPRKRSPRESVPPAPAQPAPQRSLPDGLDDTDLQILSLLAEDARYSQRALARSIGMSPAAVSERIARLEHAGVILGYQARLSFVALDRSMTVFVGITCVQGEDQRQLASALLDLPVVESVDIVMGPMDLMVRLRVRDHAHLREVFFDQILPMPGVHRTESFISLESIESENFAKAVLDSNRHPTGPQQGA
jgi:Lrp/AsnC family leucine-responsive transcriptional regulator